MPPQGLCGRQHLGHAFENFHGTTREGLALVTRRNMLKASVSGVAGLSLPQLLEQQAQAREGGGTSATGRSVILLWMTGGPSHIDTWDMKPERPWINRGPFSPISTALPGEHICEHLPKQAALLDRFTIIRSVDARHSNHEPNKVFQTGHLEAAPRVDRKGEKYPAIGSVVAKHHGANAPAIPPYMAFQRSRSHIGYAGYLGREYDPFLANQACSLPIYDLTGRDTGRVSRPEMFDFAQHVSHERVNDRQTLLKQLDRIRKDLDQSGNMDALNTYQSQAIDMLLGGRAREAFDISREPDAVRARYGAHLWCQQALLARRLVEAGVSFVTLDLSYHTASGTWDTHGDNIPPYGGISKGLGPLLPLFDHLLTTLVTDFEARGRLQDVLVIAMGEFGRTPNMGTQESTDGRNHWPVVMSMCLAGGRFRHGQIIGSTERDGGHIKDTPVTPGDIAATIYHHMGVPLNTTYDDDRGRPLHVVQNNGRPIAQLL